MRSPSSAPIRRGGGQLPAQAEANLTINIDQMVAEARRIEREATLLDVRRFVSKRPVTEQSRTSTFGTSSISAHDFRDATLKEIDSLLDESAGR